MSRLADEHPPVNAALNLPTDLRRDILHFSSRSLGQREPRAARSPARIRVLCLMRRLCMLPGADRRHRSRWPRRSVWAMSIFNLFDSLYGLSVRDKSGCAWCGTSSVGHRYRAGISQGQLVRAGCLVIISRSPPFGFAECVSIRHFPGFPGVGPSSRPAS